MSSCLLCLNNIFRHNSVEISRKVGDEKTVRDAISENFPNHEVSFEFSLFPSLTTFKSLPAPPQRLISLHLQLLLQKFRRFSQFYSQRERKTQFQQHLR